MMEDIKTVLSEFGLSSKEADVYLTMLELGPASVQDIAKKAGVNRSTTYVMIEALTKRGLISTFEKGKKVLFNAETPHRLLGIIEEEMGKVEAKKQRLNVSLPRLLAIFNAVEDKPRVRFFEGDEALDLMRHEVVELKEAIWELTAVDEPTIELTNTGGPKRIELNKRVSGARLLMAIKEGHQPQYFNPKGFEARTIDYHRMPFSGAMIVTKNRLYIFTAKSVSKGICVESAEMTAIARALYEIAWQTAKPWTPPAVWAPPPIVE